MMGDIPKLPKSKEELFNDIEDFINNDMDGSEASEVSQSLLEDMV